MNKILLLFMLAAYINVNGQQFVSSGGGEHIIQKSECISPEQRVRIDNLLAVNFQELKQKNIIQENSSRNISVKFNWPLKQKAGLNYNAYYGISNFVDLDPAYPNQLKDYNCGKRTYDSPNGYNHAGIDIFLWPFDINMMDNDHVQVVAAAPGTILHKEDGYFDKNCDWNNPNWNAVYIIHADNTVAWYGHLKKNSLTTKPIGASVAAGEFLGVVGSSGISSAPHLHFEIHDQNNFILDPYNGACNNYPSLWNAQKPYNESTLNTLLTHFAPPVFKDCPNTHITNESINFNRGDQVYFAAYYHDQMLGQVSNFKIYQPDGTIFKNWNHSSVEPHYFASYWYWSYFLPNNAPEGLWRYEAEYQNQTIEHNFYVGQVQASINENEINKFSVYPNPTAGHLNISGSVPVSKIEMFDLLGKVVMLEDGLNISFINSEKIKNNKGIFFIRIFTKDGNSEIHKVVFQ